MEGDGVVLVLHYLSWIAFLTICASNHYFSIVMLCAVLIQSPLLSFSFYIQSKVIGISACYLYIRIQ